jgi:hypothetical protein
LIKDFNLSQLARHSDREIARVCTHINLFDLEEVLAVRFLGCRQHHLEAEATSSEEDVSNTKISDTWKTLLSLDIVRNVSQVHLDAGYRQHDGVMVFVSNLLSSKAQVVV